MIFFEKEEFNKLSKALLCIFLEKETKNGTMEEGNSTILKVEHAYKEIASRLMGNAGKTPARLLLICTARGILSKEHTINISTMLNCNLSLYIVFYLTPNFSDVN
jgi:hypothetical protein